VDVLLIHNAMVILLEQIIVIVNVNMKNLKHVTETVSGELHHHRNMNFIVQVIVHITDVI